MSNKAVLNIRNFPPELLKRLKVKAAEEGKTLKDLCEEILWEAVERDIPPGAVLI